MVTLCCGASLISCARSCRCRASCQRLALTTSWIFEREFTCGISVFYLRAHRTFLQGKFWIFNVRCSSRFRESKQTILLVETSHTLGSFLCFDLQYDCWIIYLMCSLHTYSQLRSRNTVNIGKHTNIKWWSRVRLKCSSMRVNLTDNVI